MGGDAQHAALRPLFYSQARPAASSSHSQLGSRATQVAGLILVHDLSRRRSTAGLARWAAELGASLGPGSAAVGPRVSAAPLQQRLGELGVHVPVLVVGTRADVADAAARRRGLAGRVAAAVQRALCLGPRARPPLLPETQERRPADRDAALFAAASLRAASPGGRLDAAAVEAFFRAVLAAAPAHGRTNSRGGGTEHWAALLAAPLSEGGEGGPRYAWEVQPEEDPRGRALWEP